MDTLSVKRASDEIFKWVLYNTGTINKLLLKNALERSILTPETEKPSQ